MDFGITFAIGIFVNQISSVGLAMDLVEHLKKVIKCSQRNIIAMFAQTLLLHSSAGGLMMLYRYPDLGLEIHTYTHTHMHIYAYAPTHIHIHAYTHTHIHT